MKLHSISLVILPKYEFITNSVIKMYFIFIQNQIVINFNKTVLMEENLNFREK
jgi:hypothetical protein